MPDRQIESLIKLITQLSIKYNINPKKLQTYHRDSTIHPYIQDIVYPGIIGHTHAGKTQCPGKNLLDRIDYIRSRVYTNLNLMD